ncbi:MAG: EamA family transporter [Eubacteriales bacterium]|nr:EamA family transporter [Eubacteriales bacterium]
MKEQREKRSPVLYAALHLILFLSSLSGICSKMAARQTEMGGFLLWYGAVLAIMAVYALVWQQILKRLPVTVAYANKPVSLVWGMVFGALLFQERITWNMVLGAAIIFAGIYLVVTSNE